MAVKSLMFRLLAEDGAGPVFAKVAKEAEVTAGKIEASFSEANAATAASTAETSAAGAGGFARVGSAAKVAAVGIIGAAALVGIHATHMAADFQSSIVKLHTTAGESKKDLGLVSQGILDMAPKVGYTAQELADGLYTVESAGYHGAQGLAVLKAASEGARIEGADLTTVTDAVTSAMVDYHLKGTKGAAEATNTLIAAVGHGKTTMEGMAAAFPNVAAAASSMGISMQETAAAIATMTQHGIDAGKAGTYLRQVLGQLASGGSAEAQSAMKGLGINSLALSKEIGSQGLAAGITTIQNALQKHLTPAGLEAMQTFKKAKDPLAAYTQLVKNSPPAFQSTFGALTKMVGGVRSLQGILMLGGKNLQTFKDNTAAVTRQVDDGGRHIAGYNEYQKTFNAQSYDAKAALSALGVEIGQALMPTMTTIIHALAVAAGWLAKHQTLVVILGASLTALGVTLGIVSLAIWAVNEALDANPIVLVVAGLAALAVGFYEAYQHCATFRHIVDDTWTWIKGHWPLLLGILMGPIGIAIAEIIKHFSTLKSVFLTVVHFIEDHWKLFAVALGFILAGPLGALVALVATHFGAIKDTVVRIVGDIKSTVSTGISDVVGFFAGLPGRISGFAGRMLSAGKSLISNVFHGIESAAGDIGGFIGNIASRLAEAVKNEINSVLHLPLVVNFDHAFIHIHATVIPALATGGRATGPTLAVFGEGAEPETVLPDSLMVKLVAAVNDRARDEGPGGRGPLVHIDHFDSGGLTPEQVALALMSYAA